MCISFLKANFIGIVTFSESNWIVYQQSEFTMLRKLNSLILRMINSGKSILDTV